MIDLIIAWPRHLDYPLWRRFVHDTRGRFSKVLVIFTKMNAPGDYREYVRSNMSAVTIIDNDDVAGDQDWRSVAMNKALQYSDADWVWFTEQDFFPNLGFWEQVSESMKNSDLVGVLEDTRIHPCSMFIKRETLNKTRRDFGVEPDRLDHFGKLTEELLKSGAIHTVIDKQYWNHMNGLSQNIHMLQIGDEPNFRPEEFKEYCRKCLVMNSHPDFEKLFKDYLGGEK